MSSDRITEIRIQGLRSLADVRLKLDGLTVLIGENGSGKSSLLEAFEILRKTTEPEFLSKLSYAHGGAPALLRQGAEDLVFGVKADTAGVSAEYTLALAADHGAVSLRREEFVVAWPTLGRRTLLQRDRGSVRLQQVLEPNGGNGVLLNGASFTLPEESLMTGGRVQLSQSPNQERHFRRIEPATPSAVHDTFVRLLARLHVQLPLAIRPYWTSRELGERFSLRDAATLAPAMSLARSAENLFSCFYNLRNDRAAWERTLDLIRLGIGEDVEDVTAEVVGGGKILLALRLRGQPKPIYAEALSDGQLAYLSFVALARLPGAPSLIALDEPEAHLHPHLLVRALDLLEELAGRCPVVLATHSDRLLDALPNPVESVVLCELNRERATELRRPDRAALDRWLQHYRGLGAMRAEGVDKLVVTERD